MFLTTRQEKTPEPLSDKPIVVSMPILNDISQDFSVQTQQASQFNQTTHIASADISESNAQLLPMKRPKWKLEQPFSIRLESLEREAAEGDNVARYILALNLRYCYYSALDAESLEAKLDEAHEFNDGGVTVDKTIERYEYCAGLGHEKPRQFFTHLESAALDGFVAAQEVIASITPEFYMKSQGYKSLDRDEYISKRDKFTQQKKEFLEQAALHGSVNALISLSNLHNSQTFGDNGHIKSFALNHLILELTQSNKIYNRYSWFKERQYEQLRPEQIEKALDMSNEWLQTINRNGTLYLSD
jgi:hypothetical protein